MKNWVVLNLMAAPGDSDGRESPCSEGDQGSVSGLGRSPGEGKHYPLLYSALENLMDSVVHKVTKSRTRLSHFHFHLTSEQPSE